MLSVTVTLPISVEEADLLRSLLDGGPVVAAPKASQTPAPKAKAAPAPVAPEPVVEAAEDLLGTDDEPTVEDAIKAATEAVGAGNQAAVKAALGKVGAPRVAKLTPEQVGPFLAALGA